MIEPQLPTCDRCSGSGIATVAVRHKGRLPMLPGYHTSFVPCSCAAGAQVAAARTSAFGTGGVFRL